MSALAKESENSRTGIRVCAYGGGGVNVVRRLGKSGFFDGRYSVDSPNEPQIAFVITCLGGKTGTEMAPVKAREVRESSAITIGIATLPFEFEGAERRERAAAGLRALAENTDALFVLNNNYLSKHCGEMPATEAFALADEKMCDIIWKIAQSFTMKPNS